MSVLTQFGGGSRIVTSLENTPQVGATFGAVVGAASATATTSGAMTLNVLATALTKTGRGRLNWFGVYTNDATSRTVRVKITLDGVVVKDFTSSAIAASGSGFAAVGSGLYDGTAGHATLQPLDYNTSLLVEYASSVTETGKLTVAYNHEVHQ